MNQNEQQRHQSELDSRRVSTGVRCEVITKDGDFGDLIGLLKGNYSDFIPSIDFGTHDHITGFDPVTDMCYVVPKSLREHVFTLLKTYQAAFQKLDVVDKEALPEKERRFLEIEEADIKTHNKMIAKDLLTAIQDHVFLVTLQGTPLDGKKMDGKNYDVYMHSREQSAPYAEMIYKDKIIRGDDEGNEKWTEDVQDGRERFRAILEDLEPELKTEVKNGRSSRRK